jgi:hypothetical protein
MVSGFDLKHFKILSVISLTKFFPPIFDMGGNLKERKGDIFPIAKL